MTFFGEEGGELIFHIFMNIEQWCIGPIVLYWIEICQIAAQTGVYAQYIVHRSVAWSQFFYLYFIGLCVRVGTAQWKLLTVKLLAIQIRVQYDTKLLKQEGSLRMLLQAVKQFHCETENIQQKQQQNLDIRIQIPYYKSTMSNTFKE